MCLRNVVVRLCPQVLTLEPFRSKSPSTLKIKKETFNFVYYSVRALMRVQRVHEQSDVHLVAQFAETRACCAWYTSEFPDGSWLHAQVWCIAVTQFRNGKPISKTRLLLFRLEWRGLASWRGQRFILFFWKKLSYVQVECQWGIWEHYKVLKEFNRLWVSLFRRKMAVVWLVGRVVVLHCCCTLFSVSHGQSALLSSCLGLLSSTCCLSQCWPQPFWSPKTPMTFFWLHCVLTVGL